MRHAQIQNKFDWFYEFRPYLMLGFAYLGLIANRNLVSSMSWWLHLSQVSGLTLLALAVLIIKWRRDYRRQRSS